MSCELTDGVDMSMRCAKLAVVILSLMAATARAGNVVTDGSLGAPQTLRGSAYFIDRGLGQLRDHNLFHSFAHFDLAKGDVASFDAGSSVQNIFVRVTGRLSTRINGTISAPRMVDFYLMNANGVLFGADAVLDVHGSFAVTTANELKLDNGGIFHAAAGQGDLLNTSSPASFGFLGTHVGRGGLHGVNIDGSTLTGEPLKTIRVIGAPVIIKRAQLIVEDGRVEIVGINQTTSVDLRKANRGNEAGGMVQISDGTLINVNGSGKGMIRIRGGDLALSDSTLISAATDNGAGGSIDVQMKAKITIQEGATIASVNRGAGTGAQITVNASKIELESKTPLSATAASVLDPEFLDLNRFDGGIVSYASAASTGQAGPVSVTASVLSVNPGGQVSSYALGAGGGGMLSFAVGGNFFMNGTADRAHHTGIFSAALTPTGGGGSIGVQAGNLTVMGGAQIDARTTGAGNGGDITVSAASSVKLGTGARITSATFGSGAGGSINIARAGNIVIDGGNVALSTSIFSASAGPGPAGAISLSATNLRIASGGTVTDSGLIGAGGDINVNARATLDRGKADFSTALLPFLQDFLGSNGVSFTPGDVTAFIDGVQGVGTLQRALAAPRGELISDTYGAAKGGNISFDRHNPKPQLLGGAAIITQSYGTGTPGVVSIEVTGGLIPHFNFPTALKPAALTLFPLCGQLTDISTFLNQGRGGTPEAPGTWDVDLRLQP